MAGPCACQSFCQYLSPTGKDELFGAALKALTNDNKTLTCTSAILRAQTLTPAPPLASANLMAKYSKENLQWIFKTVLEARAPTLAL